MSEKPGIQHERRRSVRLSPKGTILVHGADGPRHGRIANLSRGGMLVASVPGISEDLVDRTVEIELRLDGGRDEWLRISGRIRRITAGTIAIEVVTAPAAFGRLIDDNAKASEAMSVVLVDATEERRAAIADAFRAVGCDVVDVSTPLEAIVRLGEARFEPNLIVIADSTPRATSDDLRRFVEREHPAATMVTVGDELVEPQGLVPWLSSANAREDMVARVRELLSRVARA